MRDGGGLIGRGGGEAAGKGREEERRSRGRTTGVQELEHNFEKLNGFKSKGMWAGAGAAETGIAGAGK